MPGAPTLALGQAPGGFGAWPHPACHSLGELSCTVVRVTVPPRATEPALQPQAAREWPLAAAHWQGLSWADAGVAASSDGDAAHWH